MKAKKKVAAPKGGTQVATRDDNPIAMRAPVALPKGFKMVRQVTMPTLNLKVGEPRTLLITSLLTVSTYVEKDPKKAKEKPATVCEVGDTQDGLAYQLLVPSVLESELREKYPDDSYKGKTFYMEKLPKRPNKRYFDFMLMEVAAD